MKNKTPNHIGIIMDGNRRFAEKLMKKPWMGHKWGAEKVKSVVQWSRDNNIKEITLYTLSLDNFNRPKKEFETLMELFNKEFKNGTLIEDIHKNKIKINMIGEINRLPANIQKTIKKLEQSTKDYSNFTINFAIAYGGKNEIINAAKRIAEQTAKGKIKTKNINEDLFKKYLYLKNQPDMIIRTGGEKRLSDFLTWHASYSELFFLDTLWPELTEEEFVNCITEFTKRKRKFGK